MKFDHRVLGKASSEKGPSAVGSDVFFHIESFRGLLAALVLRPHEIDVDLLIMIREEVHYFANHPAADSITHH